MRGKREAIICAVIGLVLITLAVNAQPKDESEREEMYRRYLEFPKYVKGGTVEPHWMADGNSFWYAEGAPESDLTSSDGRRGRPGPDLGGLGRVRPQLG